jgi:hypothetical protein
MTGNRRASLALGIIRALDVTINRSLASSVIGRIEQKQKLNDAG